MMEQIDRDMLIRIDGNVAQLLKSDTDQESRLRGLERESWLHRGGLLVVGLLVTGKLGMFHGFG